MGDKKKNKTKQNSLRAQRLAHLTSSQATGKPPSVALARQTCETPFPPHRLFSRLHPLIRVIILVTSAHRVWISVSGELFPRALEVSSPSKHRFSCQGLLHYRSSPQLVALRSACTGDPEAGDHSEMETRKFPLDVGSVAHFCSWLSNVLLAGCSSLPATSASGDS